MADPVPRAIWSTYRFEQMAEHIAERVQPTPEDGPAYVGLEHLDSGSLIVRRWGTDVALVGTKLRMRRGDILFARRNAYLRRVAVAPHDGLFSAHGMVLRARPNVVLPEFLPFFMQSSVFMDRAIEISVGSLSPTVNWKTLAKEVFALPPLEEQRRLAGICNASGRLDARLTELCLSLDQLRHAALSSHYSTSGADASKRTCRLEDVLEVIIDYRGKSPPKAASGVPLITAKNVRDGFINPEPREYIDSALFDGWMTRGLPSSGDVLFTTEAPLGNVAAVPEYKFALGQRVVLLRADIKKISARYLYWLLRSPGVRREVLSRASGTTALGIKQSLLRTVPIVVHPYDQQIAVCRQLDLIESRLFDAERRLDLSRDVTRILRECVIQ